jgi:hypothetical protein
MYNLLRNRADTLVEGDVDGPVDKPRMLHHLGGQSLTGSDTVMLVSGHAMWFQQDWFRPRRRGNMMTERTHDRLAILRHHGISRARMTPSIRRGRQTGKPYFPMDPNAT